MYVCLQISVLQSMICLLRVEVTNWQYQCILCKIIIKVLSDWACT